MKRRWFNLETRPSRLFGDRDRDRDGVANVFDCQPNNRRRQDGDNMLGRSEKAMKKELGDNSLDTNEKVQKAWKIHVKKSTEHDRY